MARKPDREKQYRLLAEKLHAALWEILHLLEAYLLALQRRTDSNEYEERRLLLQLQRKYLQLHRAYYLLDLPDDFGNVSWVTDDIE